MTPATRPHPTTCQHCPGVGYHELSCTRPLYPERIEWFGRLKVYQPVSVHTAATETAVSCA